MTIAYTAGVFFLPLSSARANFLVSILACLIGTIAAGLGALLGVFLAPLHFGSIPAPLGVLATSVLNILSVWFVLFVAGRFWTVTGPILAWLIVIGMFAFSTPEGDVALPNSWVTVLTVFLGALTLTVAVVTGLPRPGATPVKSHE